MDQMKTTSMVKKNKNPMKSMAYFLEVYRVFGRGI